MMNRNFAKKIEPFSGEKGRTFVNSREGYTEKAMEFRVSTQNPLLFSQTRPQTKQPNKKKSIDLPGA